MKWELNWRTIIARFALAVSLELTYSTAKADALESVYQLMGLAQTTPTLVAVPQPSQRFAAQLSWDDDATVRLFTPLTGHIISVTIDVGRKVQKGECLARIESPDYRSIQSELRQTTSAWIKARLNLERVKSLAEHGVVVPKTLESAQAEYTRCEADRIRAEGRLAAIGGKTNSPDQPYELRSPIEGVVVERNVSANQAVRPDAILGDPAMLPLFVVTDPTRLRVDLDVPGTDLSQFRPGQELLLHSPEFPGQVFRGTIKSISEFLDPSIRTARISGSVINPDSRLKPGTPVSVEISK